MAVSLKTLEGYLDKKYQNPFVAAEDIQKLVLHYSDLRPKMSEYVFQDGSSRELLKLSGTIPVIYRGSCYNIPVEIWVHDTHPLNPPICYVKPTSDMKIKQSRHVDQNGRVFLPYLADWNQANSDLLECCQIMALQFGEVPPVYSKKVTADSAASAAVNKASGQAPVCPLKTEPSFSDSKPVGSSKSVSMDSSSSEHDIMAFVRHEAHNYIITLNVYDGWEQWHKKLSGMVPGPVEIVLLAEKGECPHYSGISIVDRLSFLEAMKVVESSRQKHEALRFVLKPMKSELSIGQTTNAREEEVPTLRHVYPGLQASMPGVSNFAVAQASQPMTTSHVKIDGGVEETNTMNDFCRKWAAEMKQELLELIDRRFQQLSATIEQSNPTQISLASVPAVFPRSKSGSLLYQAVSFGDVSPDDFLMINRDGDVGAHQKNPGESVACEDYSLNYLRSWAGGDQAATFDIQQNSPNTPVGYVKNCEDSLSFHSTVSDVKKFAIPEQIVDWPVSKSEPAVLPGDGCNFNADTIQNRRARHLVPVDGHLRLPVDVERMHTDDQNSLSPDADIGTMLLSAASSLASGFMQSMESISKVIQTREMRLAEESSSFSNEKSRSQLVDTDETSVMTETSPHSEAPPVVTSPVLPCPTAPPRKGRYMSDEEIVWYLNELGAPELLHQPWAQKPLTPNQFGAYINRHFDRH